MRGKELSPFVREFTNMEKQADDVAKRQDASDDASDLRAYLEAAKGRVDATTAGPWDGQPIGRDTFWTWVSPIQGTSGRMLLADAAFVAESRLLVPALIEFALHVERSFASHDSALRAGVGNALANLAAALGVRRRDDPARLG